MITVFPKRTVSILSLVVFLTGSTGNQLNGFRNNISPAAVNYKKMDMLCEVLDYVKSTTSISGRSSFSSPV